LFSSWHSISGEAALMATSAIAASLAFIVTVVAMPVVRGIANRSNLVARPREDRWHRGSIPVLGGAAITIGFLTAAVATHSIDAMSAIAIAMMFGLGLIDDIFTLAPLTKLILQSSIVILYVVVAPAHFDDLPVLVGSVALVFWTLSLVNAVNLLDHLDGVSAGTASISALAVALIFALHGNPRAGTSAALAGACAGFLLYNFNPASIFMGDSGSLMIGMVLGRMTLRAGFATEHPVYVSLAIALLLAFTPILDTCTVTATRLMLGSRVSVGGRDHSSHRLVAMGLSDRRAALFLYGISALAAALAIFLSILPAHHAMLMAPAAAVAFISLALFLVDHSFKLNSPAAAFRRVGGVGRFLLSISYKRQIIEIVLDAMSIALTYGIAAMINNQFAVTRDQSFVVARALPIVIPVCIVALWSSGAYRSIWRYTGIADMLRVLGAMTLAVLVLGIVRPFVDLDLRAAKLVIFWMLGADLLIATRVSLRVLDRLTGRLAATARNVIGIGDGAIDERLVDYLCRSYRGSAAVVGLLCGDDFLHRRTIHGVPVLGGISRLEPLFARQPFQEIVLLGNLHDDEKLEIVRFAGSHDVRMRVLRIESTRFDN
jgi:UDP-GlcNAc:undecaprenyl-phosphate GlcNAc-1-phosphate transferase